MLVTRFGVLSWAKEVAARESAASQMLQWLATRLLETCDSRRVQKWCGLEAETLSGMFSQIVVA